VVSEDPRLDRLIRRIEGPLEPAATRAAEDRVWRRLREGRPTRGRSWAPALAVIAFAIVVLVGGAYLQSYRIDVASGGPPILYREEIAKVEFDQTAFGSPIASGGRIARGSLTIEQGHFSESAPQRLVVVALVDVRVPADRLPATFEVRYREAGSAVSGTLARYAGADQARPATGGARYTVTAPLPPVDRGDLRTFDVWVHVETAVGVAESQVVTVELRGAPEGQRGRLISVR
jgi:hypothetical protein